MAKFWIQSFSRLVYLPNERFVSLGNRLLADKARVEITKIRQIKRPPEAAVFLFAENMP